MGFDNGSRASAAAAGACDGEKAGVLPDLSGTLAVGTHFSTAPAGASRSFALGTMFIAGILYFYFLAVYGIGKFDL